MKRKNTILFFKAVATLNLFQGLNKKAAEVNTEQQYVCHSERSEESTA
ncbi:MAG: hypothetical protein J7577_18875 [Sphingobacteriaceae bacterium]|nr:hypothetical protein [Sphingobacteriaceae bacterium]